MNIIFDLDGTLADCEHRRHHVAKPRTTRPNWDQFYLDCVDDPPIWPVITTLRSLAQAGHRVEIWSGRSDVVRAETERWIEDHIGLPCLSPSGGLCQPPLLMRPDGNSIADDVLKASWLLEAKPRGFWPDLVFDDRQRVVDMWRRHDIVCAQVAEGAF